MNSRRILVREEMASASAEMSEAERERAANIKRFSFSECNEEFITSGEGPTRRRLPPAPYRKLPTLSDSK